MFLPDMPERGRASGLVGPRSRGPMLTRRLRIGSSPRWAASRDRHRPSRNRSARSPTPVAGRCCELVWDAERPASELADARRAAPSPPPASTSSSCATPASCRCGSTRNRRLYRADLAPGRAGRRRSSTSSGPPPCSAPAEPPPRPPVTSRHPAQAALVKLVAQELVHPRTGRPGLYELLVRPGAVRALDGRGRRRSTRVPGGTIRWTHANGDTCSGTYVELVPARRVVFTLRVGARRGRASHPGRPPSRSTSSRPRRRHPAAARPPRTGRPDGRRAHGGGATTSTGCAGGHRRQPRTGPVRGHPRPHPAELGVRA